MTNNEEFLELNEISRLIGIDLLGFKLAKRLLSCSLNRVHVHEVAPNELVAWIVRN